MMTSRYQTSFRRLAAFVQIYRLVADSSLIDFAEDKIAKLSQYSERVMEAHVTLKVDKAGGKNNKACEIRLAIPGDDLFASKQCNSFEEAILKTSEALKQQLLRWKNKHQKTRHLFKITFHNNLKKTQHKSDQHYSNLLEK